MFMLGWFRNDDDDDDDNDVDVDGGTFDCH